MVQIHPSNPPSDGENDFANVVKSSLPDHKMNLFYLLKKQVKQAEKRKWSSVKNKLEKFCFTTKRILKKSLFVFNI